MKWAARILLALAAACMLTSLYMAWSVHREEVERVRFALGPNATTPGFKVEQLAELRVT